MKNFNFIFLVFAILFYSINVFPQTISINANTVVQPDHCGFGIQFHAEQLLQADRLIFGQDETQWQNNIVPLIQKLSPKVVKMALPLSYWEPELGQQNPDSDWCLALYRVLDEFKAQGIEIFFQEWAQFRPAWCPDWEHRNYIPPEEIDNFARSMTQFIKYLVMEKGYYNIRSFCVWNEPNNYYSSSGMMEQVYRALRKYFDQEKIPVKLTGPDACQLDRAQGFRSMMDYFFGVCDDIMDEYNFNLYSTFEGGDAYTKSKQMVDDEVAYDRTGKRQPIVIYEGETQTSNVASEGGYYIDTLRAGIASVMKWWCWDTYFNFSWEALQSGGDIMIQVVNKVYTPKSGGNFWAHALGCKYSYHSAKVYSTTTSGNIKAGMLKDNDSDSYSLYVYNSGSATNVTFNINNGLSKTFQKFVHQTNDNCFNPVGTVNMSNGTMTDNVPAGFTIYYSQGAKETTPPSAPSNLQATVINPYKLKLTWTSATDNVRVARYNIYKNGSGTPTIAVRGTAWEDSHVTPGASCSYVVKAVDGAGNESTTGASINLNIPPVSTARPSTPSNIAVVDSLAEIELSWPACSDDSKVVGYKVYERLEGESNTRVSYIYGNPPKSYYVSPGYGTPSLHRENVNHYISITSVDDEGNESIMSSSITVLIPYGRTMDMDRHYDYFCDGLIGPDSCLEGVSTFTITGSANSFRTSSIGFNTANNKLIFIRMKNMTTRNQLQISWDNLNGSNQGSLSTPVTITTNDTTFKDYVINLTGQSNWTGTVSRIYFQFNGSGTGPVAIKYLRIGNFPIPKPTASNYNPGVGVSVNFSGSGSTPAPGGTINQYLWDFGDNQTASGQNVSHSYSQAGVYTVKLKCIQDNLVWGEDTITITVGNPAPAQVQGVDVVGVTRTRIDILWNKNTESDIASYNIYRSQNKDFIPDASNRIAAGITKDYYCDTGLNPSTVYYYRVSAVDTASQEGPPSEVKWTSTRTNDCLYTNADFETGSTSGWSGGGTIVTGNDAHHGNYAVRFQTSGSDINFSRSFNVTIGQRYRFLFFIYISTCSNTSSQALITAVREPSWAATYAGVDHINQPLNKWFYISYEFTPTYNQAMPQFWLPTWTNCQMTFTLDDIYVDLVPQTGGNPPNKPSNLRCEGLVNPTNVTKSNPTLSWTFSDPTPGNTQTAYQIIVSTNQNNVSSGIGDSWNTGMVFASQTQAVYSGRALMLGATYYWRIKYWNNESIPSEYSDTAYFVMSNTNNPPNAPTNLLCDGKTNPSGLTNFVPVFSWTFSDPDTGQSQGAYRLLIADNMTDLNNNTGNVWDTGKVINSASSVQYNGSNPLQAGATYYWKVMTWDGFDLSGPYSSVANFSMSASQTNTPPTAPTNLRCNGQVTPRGLTNFTPTLSWTFNDIDPGATQYAYRILVANSSSTLNSNNGNMWDTDKVISGANSVVYAGSPLQPSATYYWKVMTWDNFNSSSPYSNSTFFTMAQGGSVINPTIQVSAMTLDFEEVPIGEQKTLQLIITNATPDPNPFGKKLSGSISVDVDWITVEPVDFEGDYNVINVTVDNEILNMKKGNYSGNLTITSNGGDPVVVEVLLTATCILTRPNPYYPDEGKLSFFGSGIVPGNTVIKIYSVSGELIKRLDSENGEITWDGKNEKGKDVSEGIYIYTYDSPKEKGIGKFTLIRK